MRNDAIQLDGFWDILTRLKDDAQRCLDALEATAKEDAEGRAFWRRMYALAVFSFFDGVTYRMAYHAYAARERRGVTFSLEELTRLEKMYDFDESPDAVSVFGETRMLDDIKFVFNAFARVHYSDYVLPTSDPGAVFLREVAYIRTFHLFPKAAESLEVFEENVDDLLEGMRWYVERVVELLESSLEHMKATVAGWDDADEVVM